MIHDWRPFGARLRDARIRAELTQSDLAERLRLESKAAISHWETGRNGPQLSVLVELSGVLRASIDWLLFGPLETPSPEAMEVAKEYERLSPHAREKFRAALQLVKDPPPPDNVHPIRPPSPLDPVTGKRRFRKGKAL